MSHVDVPQGQRPPSIILNITKLQNRIDEVKQTAQKDHQKIENALKELWGLTSSVNQLKTADNKAAASKKAVNDLAKKTDHLNRTLTSSLLRLESLEEKCKTLADADARKVAHDMLEQYGHRVDSVEDSIRKLHDGAVNKQAKDLHQFKQEMHGMKYELDQQIKKVHSTVLEQKRGFESRAIGETKDGSQLPTGFDGDPATMMERFEALLLEKLRKEFQGSLNAVEQTAANDSNPCESVAAAGMSTRAPNRDDKFRGEPQVADSTSTKNTHTSDASRHIQPPIDERLGYDSESGFNSTSTCQRTMCKDSIYPVSSGQGHRSQDQSLSHGKSRGQASQQKHEANPPSFEYGKESLTGPADLGQASERSQTPPTPPTPGISMSVLQRRSKTIRSISKVLIEEHTPMTKAQPAPVHRERHGSTTKESNQSYKQRKPEPFFATTQEMYFGTTTPILTSTSHSRMSKGEERAMDSLVPIYDTQFDVTHDAGPRLTPFDSNQRRLHEGRSISHYQTAVSEAAIAEAKEVTAKVATTKDGLPLLAGPAQPPSTRHPVAANSIQRSDEISPFFHQNSFDPSQANDVRYFESLGQQPHDAMRPSDISERKIDNVATILPTGIEKVPPSNKSGTRPRSRAIPRPPVAFDHTTRPRTRASQRSPIPESIFHQDPDEIFRPRSSRVSTKPVPKSALFARQDVMGIGDMGKSGASMTAGKRTIIEMEGCNLPDATVSKHQRKERKI